MKSLRFPLKETRYELDNSLSFDMKYQPQIIHPIDINIFIYSLSLKDNICKVYCSIIKILCSSKHNIKKFLPTRDDQ